MGVGARYSLSAGAGGWRIAGVGVYAWCMVDWSRLRVIVTGGAGFLGRQVCRVLRERGVAPDRLFVPRRRDFDLTREADAARLYREAFPGAKADAVVHAAAEVGGIGANRDNPGRYFYSNMAMALHLIEQARLDGLAERRGPAGEGGVFVQVGTICAYPKHTPVPFREDDLWNGYPEETNAPYGVAKKSAWQMLAAYRAQYGFRSAFVLPVNLYGPGDNFDPASSHVIPALIRRCVEARRGGAGSITCWGTGSASREFLYVDDCAEGVVRALERLRDPTPVNLGTGSEVTIRDLASLIARATGFSGRIEWDASKPDGQPRRRLDTSRARELLGFSASVGLEEGVRRTVEWYEREGREARA